MQRRVLILGARAPVALELCRHFRSAGHHPYCADSVSWPMSRLSRSSAGCFRLPSPRSDLNGYEQALRQLIWRLGIELVIPTCEEVVYLSQLAEQLPAPVFCDGFARVRALHSKWEILELARDCGLRIPRSQKMPAPLPWLAGCVYKPEFTRCGWETLLEPSAARVAALSAGRSWVVQERLHGRELTTYAVAHRGRLTAFAAYRPGYRPGTTSGLYFQRLEHPQALEACRRLALRLELTGQFGLDLMETSEGLALLECNPRANSGAHLFRPGQLARAILDDRSPLLVADGPSACLAPAVWLRGLGRPLQTWRDLAAARNVLTEPLVWLATWLGLLEAAWVSLVRGISFKQAATGDIEWDGPA